MEYNTEFASCFTLCPLSSISSRKMGGVLILYRLAAPIGACCRRCAYPLPDRHLLVCGRCIKEPPPIDNTAIAYRFEEPLRGLIHQFKYQKGLYLKSFLSHLIIKNLDPSLLKTECLIPVPLHRKKLRHRGFNQAAVLTQVLACELKLPYDLFSCQKIKNTLPQASLDGEDRRRNLRGAFQVKTLPYQHVTLVDDLLTSGSTVNELALTLKKSGVKQVDVWCCARAIYE